MKPYASLSPRGQLVAEYIERSTRYRFESDRADLNMALKDSPELAALREETRELDRALNDEERAATHAFFQARLPVEETPWDRWLRNHVKQHPSDALEFLAICQDFSWDVFKRNGPTSFPWRIEFE